jgi:hypothetical protein
MRNCLANWIVIFAYFAFDRGIGFYYRRPTSGHIGEFFVFGRGVPGWTTATFHVSRSDKNGTPRANVFALSGENGRLVCQ